jgi:hypothetical protein
MNNARSVTIKTKTLHSDSSPTPSYRGGLF